MVTSSVENLINDQGDSDPIAQSCLFKSQKKVPRQKMMYI